MLPTVLFIAYLQNFGCLVSTIFKLGDFEIDVSYLYRRLAKVSSQFTLCTEV